MAGTLTIDTLKASSGVLATQNGMNGIAKAWVTFNPATGTTVVSSFNVSSITKNGVGDYTLSFTTALPNSNYAAFVCGQAGGAGRGFQLPTNPVKTTSQCELYFTISGSTVDPDQAYFAAFA